MPAFARASRTWRQFSERYDLDLEEYCDLEGANSLDPNADVDWSNNYFTEIWMYNEAPERKAYELLNNLDLGPKLTGPDAVGELILVNDYTMVSEYWQVEAADEITLSLLQERLNALETGVKIVMA